MQVEVSPAQCSAHRAGTRADENRLNVSRASPGRKKSREARLGDQNSEAGISLLTPANSMWAVVQLFQDFVFLSINRLMTPPLYIHFEE